MFKMQYKWLYSIVLVFALVLVACSGQTPEPGEPGDAEEPPAEEPEEPEEGQAEEPEEPEEGPGPLTGDTQPSVPADLSLDPANASGDLELGVNDLVYDGLTGLDANGNPVGLLASSWLVAEDGLAYTFYLRPGLMFSDGTPVDTDAVSANFNRWFDPDDALRGSGSYDAWLESFFGFAGELNDDETPVSLFDGIERVDALTFILHLNSQDPDLLYKLAEVPFSIVSQAALEESGGDYGGAGSSVSGSGAYMVGEWSDEQLVLVPNPNYQGDVPADNLAFPVE